MRVRQIHLRPIRCLAGEVAALGPPSRIDARLLPQLPAALSLIASRFAHEFLREQLPLQRVTRQVQGIQVREEGAEAVEEIDLQGRRE